MLSISGVWTATKRRSGGGVRGGVECFSRGSRLRMLETVARVKRRSLCRALFVTLTYPADFSHDAVEWHNDLEVWWKRVGRRWPSGACVWRLEPQKRGAPHFHLLVFGVRFMAHEWLRDTWSGVVGDTSADFLSACTSVERVRSVKGAWAYVSKYVGKTAPGVWIDPATGECITPGRFWGVKGRGRVPWSPVRVFRIDAFRDRQALLGYIQRRSGYAPAFDAASMRYFGTFDADRCIVGRGLGHEVVYAGPSEGWRHHWERWEAQRYREGWAICV
jgi:hypothetical protein